MDITIPDNLLQDADLDERTLAIEMACHLFDIGRFSMGQAMSFVNMGRTEFEDELFARKIPAYRLTREDFQMDLEALAKMRKGS